MPTELPRYKQEILQSGLTQKEWYRTIYLRSDHWLELRRDKLEQTGRECQHRGKNCQLVSTLDVHHLNYRDIYDVTLADLQVVCRSCHNELHDPNKPKSAKKKKKKAPVPGSAKKEFKLKMFLKFAARHIASFDGARPDAVEEATEIVRMMKGFIECKKPEVNRFINFAIIKMDNANNLTPEKKTKMLCLKQSRAGLLLRNKVQKAARKAARIT